MGSIGNNQEVGRHPGEAEGYPENRSNFVMLQNMVGLKIALLQSLLEGGTEM